MMPRRRLIVTRRDLELGSFAASGFREARRQVRADWGRFGQIRLASLARRRQVRAHSGDAGWHIPAQLRDEMGLFSAGDAGRVIVDPSPRLWLSKNFASAQQNSPQRAAVSRRTIRIRVRTKC
jgi:hypothetical protein